MAENSLSKSLKPFYSGNFRRPWMWYLLAVVVPLLVITADGLLRGHQADHQAGLWFEALDLSSVALYPSGTSRRHPETIWPGMTMHFLPGLPQPRLKNGKHMGSALGGLQP